MQLAVDAQANAQPVLLRLDVDVGRADLGRVLEQRLEQAHHRRVLGAERGAERAEIDEGFAEVLLQLLRKTADLLGATVDLVERLENLLLGHHDRLDVALEKARQLIEGEEIGRIAHRDDDRVAALLQRHGAKAARRRLRQLLHHLEIEVVLREIDVAQAELARERLRKLLVLEETELHQHAPEAPAAAGLLLEGHAQLLHGEELLRNEHIPEPDALRSNCRTRRRCRFLYRLGHIGGQVSAFPPRLQVRRAAGEH